MKKYIRVLWLAGIAATGLVAHFERLEDIITFSDKLPREPKPDNSDWVDPDFTSVYKSLEPGFFKTVLIDFGLAELTFDVMRLKAPLDRLVKRAQGEETKKHPVIRDLVVPKESTIVFFGDLHGSIHSFVRDLKELKKRGIIDESCTIVGDSTYIILLGDVINRGTYTYELLEVITYFMERNPERFIYLRGHQESFSYWKSFFAMRVPLKRWRFLWGDENAVMDPLEEELNSFFETLPDILRITVAGRQDERIYAAHEPVSDTLLREPGTQAMIAGDFVYMIPGLARGLNFMGFNEGVATWHMLSCPNWIYRTFYQFFNDSFAVLSIKNALANAVLTHCYQDMKTKEDFQEKRYNSTLGYALTSKNPEVPACVIPLCSTQMLSGPLRSIGISCLRGLQSAICKVNEAGGINGCFFRLVIYDDGYNAIKAVRNVERIKKNWATNFLVVPCGSPTLLAYFDQIKAGDLSVFFPLAGGAQFRRPELQHIVHLCSAVEDEARCLVNHLIENYGVRKFAVVYENDAYGIPLMEALRAELHKKGIKDITEVPSAGSQISFKDEVRRVKNSNPEAVALFLGSSTLAQNFLIELGATFPIGRYFFATSLLDDETFRFVLHQRGIECAFSYNVPNPWGTSSLAIEYKKAMAVFNYTLDGNSLEGYLAGMLIVDAIAHTKPPYTGRSLMRYITSLKDYAFKELMLTFNPETRGLGLPVWIRSEDGEWLEC